MSISKEFVNLFSYLWQVTGELLYSASLLSDDVLVEPGRARNLIAYNRVSLVVYLRQSWKKRKEGIEENSHQERSLNSRENVLKSGSLNH